MQQRFNGFSGVLLVTAAAALTALVLCSSCNTDGASDGSLTISFSGSDHDGHYLFCEVIKEGGDHNDTPVLALNRTEIVGGRAEMSMRIPEDNPDQSPPDLLPTADTWKGDGGTSYDAYIFIDANDDYHILAGDYYYGAERSESFVRYRQNGAYTIETDSSDFTQETGP